MNGNGLSFYILPIDTSSGWKHLIEASTAEEFQAAVARRHFDEPSFITVYADPRNWLTVGANRHQHFVTHQLTSNLITRDLAQKIIDDAHKLVRAHKEKRARLIEIRDRYSKPKPRNHEAVIYKFPSKGGRRA